MVIHPVVNVRNAVLDAAERVVGRDGIGSLTLDGVAAEAGVSKGGLLHHFPSKDRLIEGLVRRSAESWRECFTSAYEAASPGPARMVRALLGGCLSDTDCWTEQLRSTWSTVFAALAQNPALVEPMREVNGELRRLLAADGLPPGVDEAMLAAIDGLWLNWVLGITPLDKDRVARVRGVLEWMLKESCGAAVVGGARSGGRGACEGGVA